MDSILVMLRAFFRLICWNAFRKVKRRGVGSSSRDESTGTGPDREPAYLRALNLEAWTVASIAPMRSLVGVARSGQIKVLLPGSTSPSESVVRLVASMLKALQLRSYESTDEPQDEGIPASGT